MNPYLEAVRAIPGALDQDWWAQLGRERTDDDILAAVHREVAAIARRKQMVAQYAWAIPNEEAIAAIVACSPVLEVGAGGGYWARLVHQAGGDIVATDLNAAARVADDGHFAVRKMDAVEAVLAHPGRTLFLCWPPHWNPMASTALRAYRGAVVIYVGEWGGCTGDEAFHDAIDHGWAREREVEIPRWWGLNDRLYVLRRKE